VRTLLVWVGWGVDWGQVCRTKSDQSKKDRPPTHVHDSLVSPHVHTPLPYTHTRIHRAEHNYAQLLYLSMLYYEAQRSGPLPTTGNRIPWRRDANVDDPIPGGWYDGACVRALLPAGGSGGCRRTRGGCCVAKQAGPISPHHSTPLHFTLHTPPKTAGDFLKISWTNAYAATVLSWGFLEWSDAYEKAGEAENLYACIKWPLDFLLKAHTGPNEFVVQVCGNGWGLGGEGRGEWWMDGKVWFVFDIHTYTYIGGGWAQRPHAHPQPSTNQPTNHRTRWATAVWSTRTGDDRSWRRCPAPPPKSMCGTRARSRPQRRRLPWRRASSSSRTTVRCVFWCGCRCGSWVVMCTICRMDRSPPSTCLVADSTRPHLPIHCPSHLPPTDAPYAQELLMHARRLFDFAYKHQAACQVSAPYYTSTGYVDELAYAAGERVRALGNWMGRGPTGCSC
jgi:hypothetical protein